MHKYTQNYRSFGNSRVPIKVPVGIPCSRRFVSKRGEEIDEDIHVSSFLETAEPDAENNIARIFKRFPQLNVSEMARTIGIDKSLLSRYIYGIKKPSAQREKTIIEAIRSLGKEMASI